MSPSSHNRASYAAARRRPRCTCTWGAPTHSSSGPTTARRYTRRPEDKALWVASWRSAGTTWTEVFCSGLVPEDAEAQFRAIARYDPPGGTSVDDLLHHMFRLGDFACELRNYRLEQLLREPQSAAARAHRWLTAAEGDHPLSPPRPDKDFLVSIRVVNGTLEFPPQEGPHPYQDLPGGVLEAPTRHPLPTVDHRARLHDRVGGAHRA